MAGAMVPHGAGEKRLELQALKRLHEEQMAIIRANWAVIEQVAKALSVIKQKQTYKLDMKYETWDAFCKAEFDFSFRTADRLIERYDPQPKKDKAKRKIAQVVKSKDKSEGKPDTSKNGEPEGPKDAFGNVIPRNRRDAFCDPWIQETFDLFATMTDRLLAADLQKGMLKRQN